MAHDMEKKGQQGGQSGQGEHGGQSGQHGGQRQQPGQQQPKKGGQGRFEKEDDEQKRDRQRRAA